MTVPSLDQLQADAQAISATGSPKVRQFALDTVAYLRSLVPTPPTVQPYFFEDFASKTKGGFPQQAILSYDAATAQMVPGNGAITYDTYLGKSAVCFTIPASPGVTGYSNSWEQLALYFNNGAKPAWWGTPGQETWYAWNTCFPSTHPGFTGGTWYWLVGWHNDGLTSGQGIVSGDLGLVGGVNSGPVAATPAQTSLLLRWGGSGPATGGVVYTSQTVPPPLILDHWYRYVLRVIWETHATGRLEWYVDGAQRYAGNVPTLETHPDGTPDLPAFGIYLYHYKVPFATRVWHTDVTIGPTAASVGA